MAMNKADREYLNKLAFMGCVVCRNLGIDPEIPCECHHIRTGQGRKRATHRECIPLCAKHHRTGGYGIAFHAGPEEWQRRYGSELQLLEQTLDELLTP